MNVNCEEFIGRERKILRSSSLSFAFYSACEFFLELFMEIQVFVKIPNGHICLVIYLCLGFNSNTRYVLMRASPKILF